MTIADLYEVFLKCGRVCTDSRQVQEGDLYIALKGDNFDGNAFAKPSLEKGAQYVVVDDAGVVEDDRFLLVEDGLKALQQLAHHHRLQFHIPVLAITGSNGKTTTKELITAVLQTHYKVHATKGNLNNHIGVPLTLLSMSPKTEIAIIEMGANHVGEIAALCEIAAPNYGLITNVGKAHLEGFGGIEGVKKGKGELYDYLAANRGTAFINTAHQYLFEMAWKVKKVITYGERKDANHRGELTKALPNVAISLFAEGETTAIQSHLTGAYNFDNLMAAAGVGRHFDVPLALIKQGIEGYLPSNNRSQLLQKGSTTYIMDCYNANPNSMKVALENLHKADAAHKMAILGDMLELGEASTYEHQTILDQVNAMALDQVVLVGPEFNKVVANSNAHWFETTEQAKAWLKEQDLTDFLVLIKGSRGIGLERVLAGA